ncbi:MAG: hypothetical protein RMI91_04865 [Gemmatales bacterium]|nr:hypothetical protein [Gemmatales bacterium]MDW7993967.1 hypothetical protein [Gemmatales bacterium]
MWHTLLEKIQHEDLSSLTLSLDNGSAVSVQQILRVSESFVIVRGRWAGSSESGWTFVLPLTRIVAVCFPRDTPAWLTDRPPPEAVPSEQAPQPRLPPQAPTDESPAPPPQEAAEALPPPPSLDPAAAQPSLAERLHALRQRLRQRLQPSS